MLEVIDSSLTQIAQEAERRRIARELHDGAVQSLTALLTDLEFFRMRCQHNPDNADQEMETRLEMWQELARDSLLSMRQTLGGLRQQRGPADFEQEIQVLVQRFRVQGYSVTYECTDWPVALPFEYSSNLYCIVREAFTNIHKHAHASAITLFLFMDEQSLHLSIGDNGIGMSQVPEQIYRPGCQQGLVGLHERVEILGGHVMIESVPGRGTRLDIEVPLP